MQKMIFDLKHLSKDTFKIMKYGLYFCFALAIVSVGFLFTYLFSGHVLLFYLGFTLIKSSITFAVEFIICGIVVDFIRNKGL